MSAGLIKRAPLAGASRSSFNAIHVLLKMTNLLFLENRENSVLRIFSLKLREMFRYA